MRRRRIDEKSVQYVQLTDLSFIMRHEQLSLEIFRFLTRREERPLVECEVLVPPLSLTRRWCTVDLTKQDSTSMNDGNNAFQCCVNMLKIVYGKGDQENRR